MSCSFRRGLVVVGFCVGLAAAPPLPGRADDEAPPSRQYALLVGIRNYEKEQFKSLKYSENDVNDLATVLKDAGYRRVVLMTQAAAAAEENDDLLPVRENIRGQLKALLDNRKPGDTVLIAFSGHGVQFRGQKASYFCPMDADLDDTKTLISLAEVYKSMQDSKADLKVLLAGGSRNDPRPSPPKEGDKVNPDDVTRPSTKNRPGGVAALFSCSEGQQSYDSDQLKHGIFFHFVIEGLKGKAANKKGEVTLERLASYVADEVPDAAKEVSANARQRPQLVGDLSGSLPLVTGGNRPPAKTP